MAGYRYIGTDQPRPDAAEKAAGRAQYIHDLTRPGMLVGKVKHSAHAHARIRHIDTSRAERLPGVRAVITAHNTPPLRIGFLQDNPVLKGDKVRQWRDEVAAVAAVDESIAAEAIELIEVDYEPLPGVFSPAQAMTDDAPLVHETDGAGRPRTDNVLPLSFRHHSGDVEAALRRCAHVVEGEFSTPVVQQSCMGTAGCIAELDVSGNLTVWAKTQIPFLAQRDFNRALQAMGLGGRNTRVIVPTLGGAFGSGLDTHAYEYIAILLAQRSGRPVKIVYNREEEFANLSPRQSARTRVVQGCDAEGRLVLRRIEVLQDNGAYTSWGATYPTVMMLPATSLYRVPNVSFDARLVYTNNTYCQAMRGYGNPEVVWAIESNLDELAAAVGMDPYELRMRNRNEPNETTPMGLKITTCGLEQCLRRTASELDWQHRRGQGRQPRRGVGMASLFHVGGSGRIYRSDGGGVSLRLDDYGNVYVSAGGVEMGQGLCSVLSLTVAEALGVSPERIFINQTDTATCPWDVGTHASRGAFIMCNAALRAADQVRSKLFDLAAPLFVDELEADLARRRNKSRGEPPPPLPAGLLDTLRKEGAELASRLELRDNHLCLPAGAEGPSLRVPLDRMLRTLHFRGQQGTIITGDAFYEPASDLPDWKAGKGNMSATYAFGCQGVEVEVDEETGEVKVLQMVAVHDVGKVLSPQALRGQIYGALAQGVGYALTEQVQMEQGRILNPSFTDYKIPGAADLDFPVHVELVETDDDAGPFGAKGVGEPGLVPTAPAIANAIHDAVGIRIRDLPITPEKIVAALEAKRNKTTPTESS